MEDPLYKQMDELNHILREDMGVKTSSSMPIPKGYAVCECGNEWFIPQVRIPEQVDLQTFMLGLQQKFICSSCGKEKKINL